MHGLVPFLPAAQAGLTDLTPPSPALLQRYWVVGLTYLALVGFGIAAGIALLLRLHLKPVPWRERISRLVWRPWTWPDGLGLGVLLLGMHLLVSLTHLAFDLLDSPLARNEHVWIVAQSITFHWFGLGIVAWNLRRRRIPWVSAFGIRPHRLGRDIALGALLYLAAMPVLWLSAFLYQLLLRYAGYPVTFQSVALTLSGPQPFWMRVYLLFLGIGLAPLIEELLFRGIALPLCARRWGLARGVIAVALVFSMIHLHTPSVVPLFVIAVAFSLAYVYSQSVVVPVVMHSLFNAVNLGLLMILQEC